VRHTARPGPEPLMPCKTLSKKDVQVKGITVGTLARLWRSSHEGCIVGPSHTPRAHARLWPLGSLEAQRLLALT
jgi:hypothetical protein